MQNNDNLKMLNNSEIQAKVYNLPAKSYGAEYGRIAADHKLNIGGTRRSMENGQVMQSAAT